MVRTKTDRKDAEVIAHDGGLFDVVMWKPSEQEVISLRLMLTALDTYEKQQSMLNNQLEALSQWP